MYSAELLVNSPRMATGVLRCKECNMNFTNAALLSKHKARFCVGGTGDPDHLMLRKGLRSGSPPRYSSPDDRDDYKRYNPNSDQQLRSLAENHGRQMEYLQLRNKDLEKQREEIRQRLEGLGRRSINPGPDTNADLLQELKNQEERNQRALEDLKRQLWEINKGQKVSVIEVERPVYPQPQAPPPPPPPAPAPEPAKRNYVFPVYYGSSMVAEICAIRQAYLQNGGNDPDVLSQLSQMQADAQLIEDQVKNQPQEKPQKEKKPDNNARFQMLEMENDRLIRELQLIQDRNLQNQNRQQSDKEEVPTVRDELERELRRLQKDHLQRMYGLQRDVDELKLMLAMERNRPPLQIQQPPAPVQGPQPPVSLLKAELPWLFQKPYVEVEPMAPYDQFAGFVIFYDFVLSLDPGVQACRLIVGLHSSSAVMGEPTVLPTVYTEPATRGEKYNYNYSNAVVGAKQPVPKCPPDGDLGIVAELQASGGPASEHDRSSLMTRAWCKIPLFDNNGRLICGRFRVPMRNVPIKPFMHVSQIQRIPKYGEADLYYRVVNMREAEIHSMQQISAANYGQYATPQIPVSKYDDYEWPSEGNPTYSPSSLGIATGSQNQATKRGSTANPGTALTVYPSARDTLNFPTANTPTPGYDSGFPS